MAKNTDVMLRDLTNSSEFVQELLPAAERTALLYHLSYLCLANFPKLERILRQRAVETQLLFVSSKALLLKCVTTSDDLVSSLLPMLRLSVEDNQTILAVKSLEKAKTWINEIVEKVKEIIDSYEKHTKDVSACATDVKAEKAETEKEKVETSSEIKSKEKIVDKFQEDLKKITEELGRIEAKIQETNVELQNHVSDVCRKSQGLGILAAMVPFIGPIIKSIYDTATAPGATAKTQALTNELSQLSNEKSDLRNKDWKIQIQMTDLQLKLATLKIQEGTIPNPVHLGEVQRCLSQIVQILIQLYTFWSSVGELLDSLRKKTFVGEDILEGNMNKTTKSFFLKSIDIALSQIQKILIQLQKFWMSVGELLDSLKKKTFVGEDILDINMSENTKSFFLKSIEIAEEYWKTFGQGCLNAKDMFNLQSKDAYKFLESSPPVDLVEWKQEYDSVIEKLKNISPDPLCEANKAAITE